MWFRMNSMVRTSGYYEASVGPDPMACCADEQILSSSFSYITMGNYSIFIVVHADSFWPGSFSFSYGFTNLVDSDDPVIIEGPLEGHPNVTNPSDKEVQPES